MLRVDEGAVTGAELGQGGVVAAGMGKLFSLDRGGRGLVRVEEGAVAGVELRQGGAVGAGNRKKAPLTGVGAVYYELRKEQ